MSTELGTSGIITDHVGPEGSFYSSNLNCRWEIRVPEDKYVTVEVNRFFTEYTYDRVVMTDNAGSSVWDLSGDLTEPYYTFEGNIVTIEFSSDEVVEGLGFELAWFEASCATRCSGRGLCMGTACQCDEGFEGDTCELAIGGCPHGCNAPHGACTDGTCVCYNGWHGDACEDPYCSPSTHLTAHEGTLRDHTPSVGMFRPGSTCSWLISPPGAHSVVLSFATFEVHTGSVTVADGNGTHVIGVFTGFELPPPILAHSGTMLVTFHAGPDPHVGFTASYTTWQCPSKCSGHGVCLDGACHCEVGYAGVHCNETECSHACHAALTGSSCVDDVCNCSSGYSGLDCGICGDADKCGQCHGTFINVTGKMSDGPFDYSSFQSCTWTHEVGPVAVSFQVFDLHAESSVRIEDETGVVALFSGGGALGNLPPLTITSGNMVVVTFSAGNGTGTGFEATITTLTCPSHCGEHGLCLPSGACLCDRGYAGPSCSFTTCVGDCGASDGRGQCHETACLCAPGYFGPSCSEEYCYGIKSLVGASGRIADHAGSGPYMPLSSCEWRVDTLRPDDDVTIVFTHLQTQQVVDYVQIVTHDHLDNDTFSGGDFVGVTHGSFPPVPFLVKGARFGILFSSDASTELLGFELQWFSMGECPAACSGNGLCVHGECRCYADYSGVDCAESVTRTLLTLGQWHEFSLQQFERVVFYLDVDLRARFTVTVNHPDVGGDGLIVLYSRQRIPDIFNTDTIDGYGRLTVGQQVVTIRRPRTARYYFVVYGYMGGSGSIGLSVWNGESVPTSPSTPGTSTIETSASDTREASTHTVPSTVTSIETDVTEDTEDITSSSSSTATLSTPPPPQTSTDPDSRLSTGSVAGFHKDTSPATPPECSDNCGYKWPFILGGLVLIMVIALLTLVMYLLPRRNNNDDHDDALPVYGLHTFPAPPPAPFIGADGLPHYNSVADPWAKERGRASSDDGGSTAPGLPENSDSSGIETAPLFAQEHLPSYADVAPFFFRWRGEFV